jgi:hypothetical protein
VTAGVHGQKAGHFVWVRRSKLAFAMVLRIQSRVEQLRNLVQGRSHDGRVFLGCGVVMASCKLRELKQENKTLEKAGGCQSYWWIQPF